MFQEVSPRIDFPESERRILAFWGSRNIYAKTLANRTGAPPFVFFEGPPTANGLPHPGHCLTRVIKDVFPRYFTMRGYRCERKAGWDTHGLPVEIEVGRELGIHSKQEIEAYGVEPFIHRCLESVFRYTRQWEELTRRLGFWVDLDDAYVTYHQSYIESVWWILKTLFDRGLLYQGHKVVWWWAQGGTALSAGEVGEGRREVDDPSVVARFRLAPQPVPAGLPWLSDLAGVPTSLLAWTTTPWTLPSNVALAVHPDHEYVLLEYGSGKTIERFILAQAQVAETFHGLPLDPQPDLRRLATFRGRELVGLRYEPLFRYFDPSDSSAVARSARGRLWEVDAAAFVGAGGEEEEEGAGKTAKPKGTGIVHIASGFGEDDYRFAQEKGFAFLQLLEPDGTFPDSCGELAGKFCKEGDPDIIRMLKERGLLLKREVYRHSYPFCPRSDEDPLIQYARRSWFIRTTAFKDRFLENNSKIRWLPEHIREGRFGHFLRHNVDWALSRERFWGTPLPIWECEKTGFQEAIGSFAELLAKPGLEGTEVWERAKAANPQLSDHLRVHKPYIDAIAYQSPKDPGSRMRRVPEVIDCWFDSGAMPFAQWGFPHQGRERFSQQFPADFISEAIDQTRGWFYSLLAISTMLQEELGTPRVEFPIPFRACIVLGHMMGEDGKKMSKRLKNYTEPTAIFDRYGADALRWFLLAGQAPWHSIRFQESAIQESQREFLIRLHNVYSFFVIYANIDGFDPRTAPRPVPADRSPLDRWILSERHQMIGLATRRMDELDNFAAAGRINQFVDGLSNWYVRRSRERFWASGLGADKLAAHWTLYECLVELSKVLAPFVPFFAESIYQNLVVGSAAQAGRASVPESVHLCDWPAADPAMVDEVLSEEMDLVREVVSVGRAARTDAKLKVRQPLAAVEVLLADHRLDPTIEKYQDLIAEELNVKRVELASREADYVTFTIKPNLKSLGPRYGKRLGSIQKALAQADGAALRRSLVETGSVTLPVGGEPVVLSGEDVLVSVSAQPGYAASQGRRAVVALATEVTPQLKLEGLARELVHAIQGMRRDLDLPFHARIRVGIASQGLVAQAVAFHRDYLMHETLAVELRDAALPDAQLTKTFEIDGQEVVISISRA